MFQKTFLSLILSTALFAYGKTVPSLDKVANEIRSKEIAAEYAYQMEGTTNPNSFGSVARHDADTVNAIVKLLAPQINTTHIGLIGLKKWQGNQYIASLCAYHEPMKWDYAADKAHYADCDNNIQTFQQITLAVVEQKNGVWQLVAEPYTETFGKKLTEQDIKHSAFALENHTDETVLGKLSRLDFAPYQLNENTRAFGVRYTAIVGYSGGGAFNQAMTLFAVLNGKLRPVLTTDTYAFEDLAGEWNKDGSRQHHVQSAEYILKISPQKTHGFYDIIWRETRSKKPQQKIFKWLPEKQSYKN